MPHSLHQSPFQAQHHIPYERLNVALPLLDDSKVVTLEVFVNGCLEHYHNGQHPEFVRAALSGIDRDSEYLYIDVFPNRVGLDRRLKVERDYDFLVGVDDTIRVQTGICITPLPRVADTLLKDTHVKCHFQNAKVCFIIPPQIYTSHL